MRIISASSLQPNFITHEIILFMLCCNNFNSELVKIVIIYYVCFIKTQENATNFYSDNGKF